MTWNVGDKVARASNYGRTLAGPFIIERVTKRKIVLDDGSEWVNNAYAPQWGSGHGYNTPALVAWNGAVADRVDDDKRQVRAARLAALIQRYRELLTDAQLDAIDAILRGESR